MALPLSDVCAGPLDPLCQVADGVAGSVGGAASDAILGGLGSAFVTAADQVSTTALAVLDASSGIDLTADWFTRNVAVIAAVTLPAVVGLFALQILTSVLRREPGGLLRAVLGVGKALLGAALAIAVTQTALIAADQICAFVAGSAGTTVTAAAARFLQLSWLAGPQAGPVLQILLALAVIVGFLLLWGVLLFRKAALLLVVVFAPIAFAGQVWDHSRVWTRRWIEVVVALVFCKVVIVVVFVVGASAFAGVGPTAPGTASVPASSTSTGSLSDLLVGLLLLTVAAFAPWLTWRFVHWSGMEAAAVMHSAVAAGPVPTAIRSTSSQARFMAQSAATTMLLGGAGAGAGAASGGASAAGGAATTAGDSASAAARSAAASPGASSPRDSLLVGAGARPQKPDQS
ncbi:MAG: hypothetical protein LCI03_01015 [Actinobacteria bacterium]|nr:hypothetical protein [Actinomycetota bacterium]